MIIEKDEVIEWIREYFKENGPDSKAIIGLSGGKDSNIVAALCVEALGIENVIGVFMPNNGFKDDEDREYVNQLVNFINKKYNGDMLYFEHDIHPAFKAITSGVELNEGAKISLSPRLRMTSLYMFAKIYGARVASTSNKSEIYLGYTTRYGDVGDFSPLSNMTVRQVIELGLSLDIPENLVIKVPEDGLTGITDEDNFGFTYDELDKYIEGDIEDINPEVITKIETLHNNSLFKYKPIPSYFPRS